MYTRERIYIQEVEKIFFFFHFNTFKYKADAVFRSFHKCFLFIFTIHILDSTLFVFGNTPGQV